MSSQSFNVSKTMPIACGLVPPFDAVNLKKGDMSQLINWIHGTGSSIYIQWVPDEMT